MREDEEILLIEDDEDKAALLLGILRENLPNAHVRHIDDGKAAMQFLFSEESKFTKLILLDLILPNVDGIEIFKMLKADPKKCLIPVIILTSSSQTEEYISSLGLHPDGFAHKPSLRNCA